MTNKKQKQQLKSLAQPLELESQSQESAQNFEEQDIKTANTLQLIPLYRLITIDNSSPLKQKTEKIVLKAVINHEPSIEINIVYDGKDFADSRTFKQKTGSFIADISFEFNKKTFKAFYKNILDNAPFKIIYSCAGLQENKFIYANGYFYTLTNKVVIIPKTNKTKGYDCLENTLIAPENNCRPLLYPTDRKPYEILKEFCENLNSVYSDPVTMICFSCGLAVFARDIFMEIAEGFPSVFITGQHHSGKSSLNRCLAGVYGIIGDTNFTSGDSTLNAIHTNLSTRINISIHIEEAGFVTNPKSITLIKNIYSGYTREKKGENGIKKMYIYTSVFATTNNDFFNPPPELLSRILMTRTSTDKFDVKKFKYFDDEKRKELSQILPLLLEYRSKIPDIYNNVYKSIDKAICEKGRHISNIAISCTILNIINLILGYELFDWKKLAVAYNKAHQGYLQAEIKPSDTILNEITRMIENDKLYYGTDFILVNKTSLKLQLSRYIEQYNMNNPSMLMSKENFKQSVSNDPRFDCKSKTYKNIGRTISIDISNQKYLLEKIMRLKCNYASIQRAKQKRDKAEEFDIDEFIESLGCTVVDEHSENA